MTESNAMNLKCPFSWVEDMRDFLYCQTSLCMGWQQNADDNGYCAMLSNGCQCKVS